MTLRPERRSDEPCVDEGAGVVLVLAVIAVVASLTVALVATATAAVVRHRAAAGADAAALTAALTAASGPAAACAAARQAATLTGVSLRSCAVHGVDATVVVAAAPPVWLAWSGTARLNARAGPADGAEQDPYKSGEMRTSRTRVVTLRAGCRCRDRHLAEGASEHDPPARDDP